MQMNARIYADHAATTPVRPEVLDAMLPYFVEGGYNASSLHAEGRRARTALDNARAEIAGIIGAKPSEVIFTAGGSEANSLAIFGVTRARRKDGAHMISAPVEHHAVLHPLERLAEDGFDVTFLAVDDQGQVSASAFEGAIRPGTILASIMLANNEIGTLQPIAQLARHARERDVTFHTDAVQCPAYLPIHVGELGVDLLSISAHKFYGPKGVGLLFVREGTPVVAQTLGGSQEFAKRAGTENVAGIVGMARALSLAQSERETVSARISELRQRFENGLLEKVADVRINGHAAPRLANNSNVSFAGIPADAMVMRLDLEGAAVSTGSACAAGALEPSHVVAALGLPERWQRSAVRFSFGRTTSAKDIDRLVALVAQVAAELRTFSAQNA